MPTIETRYEPERGCGFRKAGGLYLVSDGLGEPCELLPFELPICPVCSSGVKQSRGWTWVNGGELILGRGHGDREHAAVCPLEPGHLGKQAHEPGGADVRSRLGELTGLLWVGERYYSPASFTREAMKLGVSKRIAHVPVDLELEKTWVLLAHPHAVEKACLGCDGDGCDECDDTGRESRPGVFHVFRPTRIEYVVKGTETDDELERLEKRGLTLVKVERLGVDVPLVGDLERIEGR